MTNINDLEKIFNAENEDPNDEYYQQILKMKKNDPEFFKSIENYYKKTTIKSSERSKNMALEEARAYKKKLAIEEKINTDELNWFMPFSVITLRVAVTAGLFIIVIGITYYQYTKPSSPTNIIANHETPIVKVSPNATYAPIVTPSPIESIDTKIVKSSNSGENNQALTPKTSVKLRKPEEPKNLYKERDKIADNTRNGNHTNITSNRAIKTVYIGYLGEIEEEARGIDIILQSALKDNGFEIFNSENIGIDKADVAITTIKETDEEYIILTDKHDKIFFKRKTAELVGKSTKEKTNLIIQELERYTSSLKSEKQN